MPKQVGNVTKASRMLQVYEVLKRKGRCTADDIATGVALALDIDSGDKNFRRTIYRDLKEFTIDNTIQVEYFTPDGIKIEPGEEDNYKNIRAEYFLMGSESLIMGGGLVQNIGGLFYPARLGAVNWQIRNVNKGFIANMFHLTFATVQHPLLALCIPKDEIPAKVIFGRPSQADTYRPTEQYLESQYGRRAALFYYPERTLSRPKEGGPDGHGIVEWIDEDHVHMKDLGSSTGCYWAPANPDDESQFLATWDNHTADSTVELARHPLRIKRDWQPIDETGIQLKTPVYGRFGDFNFYLTKAK